MLEQAHLKLLKEMESNTSSAVDKIHVWLNQNMDEEIAVGVNSEDKTIHKCFSYIVEKARKEANSSSSVMIEDDVVYSWVKEFYTNKEIKLDELEDIVEPEVTKPAEKQIITPHPGKSSKKKVDTDVQQLSLFEI